MAHKKLAHKNCMFTAPDAHIDTVHTTKNILHKGTARRNLPRIFGEKE